MYRPRQLGFLGQTPGFNPYAVAVPGSQYVLNFIVSGLQGDPSTYVAQMQSELQSISLFASGALTLIAVSLVNSTLSVTVRANSGASVLTLGGIEAAIADQVNAQYSGIALNPLDMQGGSTTSFSTQFAQQGGLTLSPLAPTTPGGTNWLKDLLGIGGSGVPTPSSPLPTWVWWALGGAVGLAAVYGFS
jgi:hypothetical protein